MFLLYSVNYLLFHVIAESFSIVVGLAIFIIVWNARQFIQNDFLKFISIAFLFISILDFLHMITYKGMGLVPGYDANLPTQFWIAARYLQAFSLLAAPFTNLYQKKLRRVLLVYSGVFLSLSLLIFLRWFPNAYIEGRGLTPFKIISEYVIIGILLLSTIIYWKRDQISYRFYKNWIVLSILLTAFAELQFTKYVGLFGFSNASGHFIKFLSFYLLYRGVVENGLKHPFDSLFSELKQKNESLKAEVQLRKKVEAENYFQATLQNNISDVVISIDIDQNITSWNPAAEELYGWSREEVIGKKINNIIFPANMETFYQSIYEEIFKTGNWQGELKHKKKSGQTFFVVSNMSLITDANGQLLGMVGINRDISQQKIEAERLESILMIRKRANFLNEKEILQLAVNEAVRITESEIGYFHFYDHETDLIKTEVWSDKVYEQCSIRDGSEYALSQCGIWVDSIRSLNPIIHNDYHQEKSKQGYPPGHVAITRHCSLPVFDGEKPAAVLGVGNKPYMYDQQDINTLEKFAEDLWVLLKEKRNSVALQKSEARFRKYFEQQLVGIAVLDSDLEWMNVNDYLINLLGHSRQSFLKQNIKNMLPAKLFESFVENKDLPETIQTKITHRTGTEIEVEISTKVVFDEENKLDYIILLVNDISARKTAELKSQQMLRRLFSIHQLHINITTHEELELISDLVLNVLKREFDFSAAVLMIKETESDHSDKLMLFAEIGFDPKYKKNHQIKKGEFENFEKLFLRNTNWIEGPAVDFLNNEAMREKLSQAGFVHYIGVPLITNHNIIGLISFFNPQPITIDYETKSFVLAIVNHLASAVANYQIINDLKQNNQNLTTSIQAIMMAWANTLELREKGNIKHAERVAEMTVQFAKHLNVPHDELIDLQRGALLHDIGKIGLPDKILSKPKQSRTDEEKRLMRQHPIYALKILSSIEYLKNAAPIPVYHHENWDGSGYPYGLSKTDIPFSARLFTIVDVWDRLTSDQPNCSSWKKEDALMHLQNLSGKQFDPKLVLDFAQFIDHEMEKNNLFF